MHLSAPVQLQGYRTTFYGGHVFGLFNSARYLLPCSNMRTPLDTSTETELDESTRLRRLQMMMNMVMQVIAQDGSLSIDEAAQMIADSRRAALAMFPDKELAYDLIWRPRFQRLMRERFRIM